MNVETTLRSEAEHVFMFVPRTTKRDVDAIAGDIGRESAEVAGQLDSLLAEEGLWSHLWYCRNTNELTRCAPLPASWVAPGAHPSPVEDYPEGTAAQEEFADG